jgi:hypothetical protein
MNLKHPRKPGKKPLVFATASFFIIALFLLHACHKNDDPGNNNPKNTDLQVVAEGFTSPIGVVAAPDNSNRLFVIDQAGKSGSLMQAGINWQPLL